MKRFYKELWPDTYYDVKRDIEEHPDYWLFIVMGGRHVGKTYSGLKYYAFDKKVPFMFIKRTNNDVRLICSKGNKEGMNVDVAPFKSLNRDMGTNIQALPIDTGLGGFYPCDEDQNINGTMTGYIMSLNAGGKYKGSDFYECEAMIFDEFAPKIYDRNDRGEGGKVLDLYGTVQRDRILREREELKLICFSNAVNVYTPTLAELEVVDDVAYMATQQDKVNCVCMDNPEEGIFIRLIPITEKQRKAEEKTGFYKHMKNTRWGAMAWDNEFSYNDFSCVGSVALKGYRPVIKLIYKKAKYYIYVNDEGCYYMTDSKTLAKVPEYNLNIERDIRRFYFTDCYDLIDAITEGRMKFKNYTMYDLIYNYKLRFKFT